MGRDRRAPGTGRVVWAKKRAAKKGLEVRRRARKKVVNFDPPIGRTDWSSWRAPGWGVWAKKRAAKKGVKLRRGARKKIAIFGLPINRYF